MTIYVVRHGQSEENLNQVYTDGSSPLSETGMKQAKFVAQRFRNIPVDKIYTSGMKRAIQTGEFIGEVIKKKIVTSDLINEMLGPSEAVGLKFDDPKAVEIFNQLDFNMHDKNYRYSNETTFEMLKERVFNFMKELENEKLENIVVVAHGYSIRAMIGYVLFGDDFTSYEFQRLTTRLQSQNTGITVFKYDANEWSLLTWNDHAHLAE